jgi:hypothetical protein
MGMAAGVHLAKLLGTNMGVDSRGVESGVAEDTLDCAEPGAAFEEITPTAIQLLKNKTIP